MFTLVANILTWLGISILFNSWSVFVSVLIVLYSRSSRFIYSWRLFIFRIDYWTIRFKGKSEIKVKFAAITKLQFVLICPIYPVMPTLYFYNLYIRLCVINFPKNARFVKLGSNFLQTFRQTIIALRTQNNI
jgi:hypothetical protein